MTLISLCMIVKNEESELPLVFSSAKDLVDETVVYDTGSDDNSIVIARQFGAKVIEGYWDKDFSRARNEALAACRGDWILWLDADESIHGNFKLLRKILADEKKLDAFLVPIESTELHGMGTGAAFHASRLFRRSKCHWSGPLHEQVVLRSNGDFPGALFMPHLRILHRGYTYLKWQSKDLYNRNLAIAKKALEDPTVPRARALFDYGRTLTQGEDPLAAVPILEEAAATTDSPTIKRASYRVIFEIYTHASMLEKAEEVIDILREEYKTTYIVDSLYAKLLLQKESYEECIKVVNRIPYSVTDDDGVEIGSFNLAWIKAHAQNALGRPGDAADTLLNVLRQHGKLDENLRVLVEYLHTSGRSAEEIADCTREESVGILSALASTLNIEDSDTILAKLLLLYPHKIESLAAIAKRLTELPIDRQMWWSNELRIRGLAKQCPLIALLADESRDPEIRLTAAAAAYLAFSDKRAIQLGTPVYKGIADDKKGAILERINGISKEYVSLLTLESEAIHITCEPCDCEGYEHYLYYGWDEEEVASQLREHSFESFLRNAIKKPINGFYEIKLGSLLSTLSHLEAGRAIKIISSLLCEGGVLDFSVHNLSDVIKSITDRDPIAARRSMYGHRRYSPQRRHTYTNDVWSKGEIIEYLEASDMTVVSCVEQDGLRLTCKKNRSHVSEAHTAYFDTSLIIIPDQKISRSNFLEWLTHLSESGELDSVEIVIVAYTGNRELVEIIEGLDGDIVKIYFNQETDFSSSFDIAIQKSSGENIIYLQSGILPSVGWLQELKTALRDHTAGILSLALTDEAGIILQAGYNLFSNLDGSLEKIDIKAYLDAKKSLKDETPVDAVSHLCFGIRKDLYRDFSPISPFLQSDDAIIDFSLRLKNSGYQNKVIKDHYITIKDIDDTEQVSMHCYPKDQSRDLLTEEWGSCLLKNQANDVPKIRASNLLPNATILEHTQKVLPISSKISHNGINLIGDFSRDLTQALLYLLKDAGVKVSEINFTYDGVKAFSDGPLMPYYINLFCVPGYRLVDLVGNFGITMAAERYNVLYWDWPLSEVSDEAKSETAMVSEVWVPSKFTYKSIKSVSMRNVQIVRPLYKRLMQPVNLVSVPDKTRFIHVARLREGWDTEEITSNALFTVEAFAAAFEGDTDVSLQIIFTGQEDKSIFSACEKVADKYRNISVILSGDQEFIRTEIANSGCYISLHKSCAYDLDVVTAVVNGVLVLATDYGGIGDIINTNTAVMLPYRQSQLKKVIFPLPANSLVAEVDMDNVIAGLREVRTNDVSMHQKSWLARKNLNSLYSSRENIKIIQELMTRVSNRTLSRNKSRI